MKKNAIALLITLLFIIAITFSIGVSLKYINQSSHELSDELFLFQSRVILKDVLNILKEKSKEYETTDNNESDIFYTIVNDYSFAPVSLANTNLKLDIEFSSARAKFNINSIVDKNSTSKQIFEQYLSSKSIDKSYIDMLEDVMNGIKEDQNYKTTIYYDMPELFKDKDNYISSLENLEEVNEFYKRTYYNNKLDIINFKRMISFNTDKNYKIDLNCATTEVLEMLGSSYIRDTSQACNTSFCDSLSDEQKKSLEKNNASCVAQKYINVVLNLQQDKKKSRVTFEFDMLSKKGSNFNYEF